jgi:hypothetical protein
MMQAGDRIQDRRGLPGNEQTTPVIYGSYAKHDGMPLTVFSPLLHIA